MKKAIIIISVLLLSTAGAVYLAPQYFIPGSVVETILIDKTDTMSATPEANDITSLLHLQDEKFQKARVRIQAISAFNYNSVAVFQLPSSIPIISNPTEREGQTTTFTQKTADAIDSVNTLDSKLNNSCIYLALITELNKIASFSDKRKIAVVYSDLFEHSSLFNVYNSKDYTRLKENPSSIRVEFEKAMKPGNLHGMQVYFIFKPKSGVASEHFTRIATLFKSILEDAGAQVTIEANLIENTNDNQ